MGFPTVPRELVIEALDEAKRALACEGVMRLLLDECIDERFRQSFPQSDGQTAWFAKLTGLKNGALLTMAEEQGFEVLITVDRGIAFPAKHPTEANCGPGLECAQQRLHDLQRIAGQASAALLKLRPGEVSELLRVLPRSMRLRLRFQKRSPTSARKGRRPNW